MADKDAAAPATAGGTTAGQASSTSWTFVDFQRAMKRSMAPAIELQAAIEKHRRDVDNAFARPAREYRRAIIGDATEEDLAEMRGKAVEPRACSVAETVWDKESLTQFLEEKIAEKVVLKKPRTPRGPTTCERLKELEKQDLDFLENAPETAVAKRIGRKSTGCFSGSWYWQNKIKPRRAEVRERKRKAKSGLRNNAAFATKAQARAANWEQREHMDSLIDHIDATWDERVVKTPDAAIDGGHSA
jgi:hypothetical protein